MRPARSREPGARSGGPIRLLKAAVFSMALLVTTVGRAWGGLDEVRTEPNLEKRSALAMDNAAAALKELRAAYNSSDLDKVKAKAQEIEESVELAYMSLEMTGKDPRRSPRWFKHAEISTSELMRSIEVLQHDMSFEDRSMLDKTKEKVQQVHDNLLAGLMGGRRK
jgi:hypothetical protein